MTDRPERIEKWSGDIWGGDPKVRKSGRIPVGGESFVVSPTQSLNPAAYGNMSDVEMSQRPTMTGGNAVGMWPMTPDKIKGTKNLKNEG